MNRLLVTIFLIIAGWPAAVCAAPDSVAVTDHTIVGIKNAAGNNLQALIVKLEVEYLLTSKSKAVLLFAVDRDAEMNFSAADRKDVVSDKKKKRIEVTAELKGFSREMLRGIILLQDPQAPAGSPPLAKTGISLDVKKFKKG